MTMRERFEKTLMTQRSDVSRDINGVYRNEWVRERYYGFADAMRLMWPPAPTEKQLATYELILVGDEPVMVMPGHPWPKDYWDGAVFSNLGLRRNDTMAPQFAWVVKEK